MLEVAAAAPDQFSAAYKTQLAWLKSYLSHTDAAGMNAASLYLIKHAVTTHTALVLSSHLMPPWPPSAPFRLLSRPSHMPQHLGSASGLRDQAKRLAHACIEK